MTGLQEFQARNLAFKLGARSGKARRARRVLPRALSTPTSASMRRCSRSTRWSRPERGSLLALDAKISLDDNALYRHADLKALRDDNEEDPKELRAAEFDLSYIALERHDRLHGERRRPRDGDHGHHPPPRRRARELLRRRRRRQRQESRRGVQDHPVRSEREGGVHQHLRRHHAVRRARPRRGRRGQGSARDDPARRSARGHQRREGPRDPREVRPRHHQRRRHDRRRAQGRRGRHARSREDAA